MKDECLILKKELFTLNFVVVVYPASSIRISIFVFFLSLRSRGADPGKRPDPDSTREKKPDPT